MNKLFRISEEQVSKKHTSSLSSSDSGAGRFEEDGLADLPTASPRFRHLPIGPWVRPNTPGNNSEHTFFRALRTRAPRGSLRLLIVNLSVWTLTSGAEKGAGINAPNNKRRSATYPVLNGGEPWVRRRRTLRTGPSWGAYISIVLLAFSPCDPKSQPNYD